MKLLLITPSNTIFMPYLKNYRLLLDQANISYDIVLWDRYQMPESAKYIFRDNKIGHQRNIKDYIGYSFYIKRILKQNNYDKIVVFGLQLLYFLKRQLITQYPGRYIIDIRDYNNVLNLFRINRAVKHSFTTVLSSRGFLSWLPPSNNYLISHNTTLENIQNTQIKTFKQDEAIEIGYIGSVRDYKINMQLIQQLANNPRYQLFYHGEGIANRDIKRFLIAERIHNVTFTGRYLPKDELFLYRQSQVINILRDETHFDNRSALPNRLYNAVIVGRPIIAFSGSYMAEIIERYHLGVLINQIEEFEQVLENYLSDFDATAFLEGRQAFFDQVEQENKLFADKVLTFISEK